MKKFFAFISALLLSLPQMAQVERPRLVVGLVVDQMRWDYLFYYYNQFQKDGLRRFVDQGFSFENTFINYVPAVTAVGHSSIYTGSIPAFTGIVSNSFRMNGQKVYCCGDTTVQSVGSNSREGQMSPRNLLASGIGDELKLATDFKSKVIGVSLKDRSAILPAGHGADAAYWWDTSAGHFVSSTYYMQELPEWVKRENQNIATKPGTEVKTSVMGVTKTFQMAEAALKNEQMGKDDITDLLTISVSSTDALAHNFGTRGKENFDSFMELDRQVARFFKALDEQVGQGKYLVFLSADHGGPHNHNFLTEHKMAAGGLDMGKKLKAIEADLVKELGISPIIIGHTDCKIYLDHEAIERGGKTIEEVRAAVCRKLEENENIMFAVDYDKVMESSIPQYLREMIINGYNKKRSGDVIYVARADWENVPASKNFKGNTHGQWNPYDTHIPFALYGWGVGHGRTAETVYITDIAPTICSMLRIQMPNSCVGSSREGMISKPNKK